MREAIDLYSDLNVVPYGINGDTMESHLRFQESLGLPFELLTDEGLQVTESYGALKPVTNSEAARSVQRTVFLVDLEGNVRYRQQGNPPTRDLIAAIEEVSGKSS